VHREGGEKESRENGVRVWGVNSGSNQWDK